jgi:hypothetical protein
MAFLGAFIFQNLIGFREKPARGHRLLTQRRKDAKTTLDKVTAQYVAGRPCFKAQAQVGEMDSILVHKKNFLNGGSIQFNLVAVG